MNAVALGPVRRLGQPNTELPFRVVVTDSKGTPFKGALVYLSSGGRPLYEISTNSSGIAEVPSPVSGRIDVRIEVAGYVVNRQVESTDETLFVQLPICSPGEILTMVELGLLAGAAGLAWAGVKYKKAIPKTVAEVILGAVVFNAVFRSSCRS